MTVINKGDEFPTPHIAKKILELSKNKNWLNHELMRNIKIYKFHENLDSLQDNIRYSKLLIRLNLESNQLIIGNDLIKSPNLCWIGTIQLIYWEYQATKQSLEDSLYMLSTHIRDEVSKNLRIYSFLYDSGLSIYSDAIHETFDFKILDKISNFGDTLNLVFCGIIPAVSITDQDKKHIFDPNYELFWANDSSIPPFLQNFEDSVRNTLLINLGLKEQV